MFFITLVCEIGENSWQKKYTVAKNILNQDWEKIKIATIKVINFSFKKLQYGKI